MADHNNMPSIPSIPTILPLLPNANATMDGVVDSSANISMFVEVAANSAAMDEAKENNSPPTPNPTDASIAKDSTLIDEPINSDDDEVIDRILPESCLLEDEGNVVAWSAFLYGLAMTAPFNFITLTLPFFASKMPNYPIEYIVTFAVNGIMVLVVLVCLANP